jgi:hypothetical protein
VLSPVACHAWPAGRPAGPRPGGPRVARVPAWSLRGARTRRRGDALDSGAMGVDRWQGSAGEHRWGPRVAPGKKNGGGAHRGGRATVGRRDVTGMAAFWWKGGSGGVVVSSGRSCEDHNFEFHSKKKFGLISR